MPQTTRSADPPFSFSPLIRRTSEDVKGDDAPNHPIGRSPLQLLASQEGMKQGLPHAHRRSNDWDGLKRRVEAFLDRLAESNPETLPYVDQLPP